MTYREQYAAQLAARPIPGYHEAFKNLEVEVEDGVWLVNRMSSCFVCGTCTEFRELSPGCSTAVCSSICRQQSSAWQKEAEESNGTIDDAGLRNVENRGSENQDLPPPGPL